MKSQYVLPITIVVAGVLIAGAVFWSGKSGSNTQSDNTKTSQNVRPYTPEIDHIVGNPNAPIKVVEYMDLECPFCKLFNTTMHQLMDFYAASGKVAFVVRPFPLAQIHSKAPEEAQAAECAAAQGGDTAYFKYIDAVFAITPSENNLDLTQLPKLAQQIGLNVDTFNSCLSSSQFAKRVQDGYNEAIAAGGQGTPFTLIMAGKDSVALPGNQPYDSMRAAIDAVLSGLPASSTQTSTTTRQ